MGEEGERILDWNVAVASSWLQLRSRHQGLFTGQCQSTHTSASHLVNVLAAGHTANQPPFITMCALTKDQQSSHGPRA